MEIKSEMLQQLINNPMGMQKLILEEIEKEKCTSISNATSPFMLLLEAASTLAHASATECKNNLRKAYPELAVTMNDLYRHLDDDELANIYATAGTAEFRFRISITDMKNNAYRPENANYVECTIPIGTTIEVLNSFYTILNPIIIRSYDITESVYVEMRPSPNGLSDTSTSMIESTIVHDKNDMVYIQFNVPIKQISVSEHNRVISMSDSSKHIIKIKDNFVKCEVIYKKQGSDEEVMLPLTMTDEYLNPLDPKAFVTLGNGTVTVEIPSMFIHENGILGNIKIRVYETKAQSFLPLHRYKEERFSLTLGKPKTPSENVLKNISIVVDGAGILSGGKLARSFEEIRKNIIYKKTGTISLPVTNYQIEERGISSGYNIQLSDDNIINRVFTASKEIPPFESNVVKCLPDFFSNTVSIKLDLLKAYYPDWVRGEEFIIKSGTIFKNINGIFEILSPSETEELEKLPRNSKVKHLTRNSYFYNFFTYSIKVNENVSDCRIYHLDNPSILALRHIAKNQNVINVIINIGKYTIIRSATGYQIIVSLDGNSAWDNIEEQHRKVQLSMDVSAGFKIYFDGVYNPDNKMYVFDIKADDFLRDNGQLQILNGVGEDGSKFINMELDINICIYTTDPKYFDKTLYLRNNVRSEDPNTTVITHDVIKTRFGREITTLWNKVFNTYTERKYKTYKEDKPLTYTHDIYKTDNDGNLVFEVNSSNTGINVVVAHKKGDVVLDANGFPMYAYRKDDIIFQNGEPVIDSVPSVVRHIDLLMMEYSFRAASASAYDNLLIVLMDFLEGMLFKDLPNMNKNLLERTKIVYRSNKTVAPVTIKANNKRYTVPYAIKPYITLYVDKSIDVTLSQVDNFRYTIGNIINDELKNKIINTLTIADRIKNTLGINIYSVQIKNMLPEDAQVAKIESENSLTINKILTVPEYKETIVSYDLHINIEKI